jgi:hypothetical protein
LIRAKHKGTRGDLIVFESLTALGSKKDQRIVGWRDYGTLTRDRRENNEKEEDNGENVLLVVVATKRGGHHTGVWSKDVLCACVSVCVCVWVEAENENYIDRESYTCISKTSHSKNYDNSHPLDLKHCSCHHQNRSPQTSFEK